MSEKPRRFAMRLEPSFVNYVGLLFSLTGCVLIALCLSANHTNASKDIYFLKITDNPPSQVTVLYGWGAYCEQTPQWQCVSDSSVMVVPFDVHVTARLNATYPSLFKDAVAQDSSLDPLAAPNPPHDPKISVAAILCLLCGGVGFALALTRAMFYRYYQDQYYSRGFLCWAAAVFALLLIAECTIMYGDAADELTVTYPHLVATQGPGLSMVGVAFASFVISGYSFMQGCFSKEEEGYHSI
ncbi:hypothetical protein BDF14DRAFT_1789893 [Spinellus fusiger]|nr:hypothetical protein BDF14DRAFT_1789893 [Spinellus fusiger]